MHKPKVKNNYILQLISELLSLIVPFITTPYVSRVLGADGIGIYSYTSSIITYFTLVAALGTSNYGAREIARNRDDNYAYSKIFWEIELLTVITSSLCLLIWAVVIISSREYRYYFLALVPNILATMVNIAWFFTGLEEIKYNVIRNAICKILGVALLFALVRKKDDLIIYVIINSMTLFIGNLSMWTYLPKKLVRVDLRKLSVTKHIKETLVFFIPTVATSVYTVLDKTLIGVITDSQYQNGFYEQATKIINIIKPFTFTALNTVMGARMSYLFSENKYDEIHLRLERSISFIILIGFGCTFGLMGIAKTFVPWFFGEEYFPVTMLLYIMSPMLIIIGVSNCLSTQLYVPSGRQMLGSKFIIVGAIVNLCLNLVLIPGLESRGAAVASVAAETIIAVLFFKYCNGYITLKILFKYVWKRFIAGIIMCISVYCLGNISFSNTFILILVQIFIGIFLYTGILIILRDSMIKFIINVIINKFCVKPINKLFGKDE